MLFVEFTSQEPTILDGWCAHRIDHLMPMELMLHEVLKGIVLKGRHIINDTLNIVTFVLLMIILPLYGAFCPIQLICFTGFNLILVRNIQALSVSDL